MNAKQYREAIAELGLNQVSAARFLHINPRTSRRLASGESKVPYLISLVLRLMKVFDIKPHDVSGLPAERQTTRQGRRPKS